MLSSGTGNTQNARAANMEHPLKIALVVPDDRDEFSRHAESAPQFGPAPTALLAGFATLPECEIHVVCCVKRPVAAPEKIGPNIFYHTEIVPAWGWLRGGYLGCIRSVRRQLQKIQPDIVHGQGTERYCALAAGWSGFPNVLTIHGNMRAIAAIYRHHPGRGYYWLAARLESLALRRAAGVFCNSAYTENLVAPCARKTWRVANALRPPFFETPLPKTPRAPILLNVGNVEPRKQTVELLALAGNLWRRGLKFELRFAGNRESRTDYGAAFAHELAAAEKAGYARHLGQLSADQLIVAMDTATGLIHVPTEEAFGLVVAEALARNLKFFGPATGGVVDIATGVDGAELFAPPDWTGLETAIARWLAADCPRPVSAANTMLERYHPRVIARRHLEIYRAVLGTSRQQQLIQTGP